MLYIVGRKTDLKIVDVAERLNVNIASLLESVAINKGGVASDYSVLSLGLETVQVQRIRAGDQWEPVWAAGEITGVNFSVFDARDKLKFSSPKSEILGNNTETCKINIKMVNSTDVDITTDLAGVYIPIQSPNGPVKKKVDFIGGAAQFDFKSGSPGKWTFPVPYTKFIGEYKVKNELTIEVLLA